MANNHQNNLFMKKAFFFLLILSFLKTYGQDNMIQLIPQPVEVWQSSGVFVLTKSSTISYNKTEAEKIARMLADKLNVPTGFALKPQPGKSGTIQLNLVNMSDQRIGNEGYTLVSGEGNIIISANQPAGLFYGVQTLLQLLPKEIECKSAVKANWSVPAVKITDYPRFGWRGIMLDVSRHFFTKEEVKSYIDRLSRYKFNTFHWHLTDDNGWRIEIKSLPKLTEVGAWRVPRVGEFDKVNPPEPGEAATYGGFYAQEDIREIIRYAQERFITIVPEIDVPGHSMAAVASYPELSCTRDPNIKVNPGSRFSEWYDDGTFKMLVDNTLNPSDEKVYEFLDKVFTELAALFPGPYIHVGGDECYKGYWEKDPGCQALMKKLKLDHIEELQGYFMSRLDEMLTSKGKKLLGWDEILEGGISPSATVMSWRGIKGGIEAAKMGHDVVMTPTTFAYLDYQQGEPTIEPPIYSSLFLKQCYNFEPVPEGIDAKYILGGQGNLWTERVSTLRHAQYMTYPRAWALAEVYWTPKEEKNWDNFVNRVETQFGRADNAEVNYSHAIYDPRIITSIRTDQLWLTMETEASGLDIYYTIDGSMPDSYCSKYTQPVVLPDEPITLRVITYRHGKPIGHLITLSMDKLKERAGK
jgi:hexosaminidase